MNNIRPHILTIVVSLLGILAGFLWWKFRGCADGSCAITSNPWLSSLFGGLFGYSASGIIEDIIHKTRTRTITESSKS